MKGVLVLESVKQKTAHEMRIGDWSSDVGSSDLVANANQLKNLFEQESALADVGGAQYLAQLQSSYVTIINAADYGKTVHDLYLRRQLIALGEDMVNDAFDHDLDVDASQQIEVSEDRLYKLAELGQTAGGLSPFRAAGLESMHLTEAGA